MQIYLFFAILVITLVLFIWGYWRYDVVALLSLIALVLLGIIPPDQAFTGFSNPAVITVACVMVITQAIYNTGALEHLIEFILPMTKNEMAHVFILSFVAAILSAFMNNVGALALMIPVTMETTIERKRSPSMLLMPLAFGSAMGGLMTVIGTPPNILISSFREQATGKAFSMFDFTPVGLIVAGVGVIFISLIGWRLVPQRRKTPRKSDEVFKIEDYITEIKIPEGSIVEGKSVKELETLTEGDFVIVGLIRGKKKRLVLRPSEELRANDILIIEASHSDLENLIKAGGLELLHDQTVSSDMLRSQEIRIVEAVVPQGSRIEGRSSHSARLRSRYRMNLLALSREGQPIKKRLNQVIFRAGDVLLLQGEEEGLQDNIYSLGLLPLAERGVQISKRQNVILTIFIFAAAIIAAALQLIPIYIAFVAAVLLMTMLNIIPVRNLYDNIDWSIIILLGAMIPIGHAMETTGGTTLIANAFTGLAGNLPPIVILGLLMVTTMTLSDFMNNAATAVVMAPIAVSIASALDFQVDPFLMTIAIGASCSFLTPIGHQNNTLVMGPGGYKFLDYLRMGLPLEILIVVISLPTIIWIWPLVH